MIIELLRIVAAVWFVIVLHEIGHIVTYKYFKDRWPNMRFKKGCFEVDGDGLTKKQVRSFIANGILLGLVAIILLFDVFQPYIIIALLVGYLWGCRDDFKALERLRVCG